MGLPLDLVSRDVLIPRVDTELLAERAIRPAAGGREGARVLDLCAGSGCVGLAIAATVPTCRAVLADCPRGRLVPASRTSGRNGLNARVACCAGRRPAGPPARPVGL